MAGTQVQFRRGTTAQHASFTGAAGEVTVDTDKKVVVVHDGSTAGGFPAVGRNTTDTLTNKTLTSPVLTGSVTSSGNPSLDIGTGTLTAGAVNATDAANSKLQISANSTGILYYNTNNLFTGWMDAHYGANSHKWYFAGVSGTPTMTLDASGNLGLGVTPSAWSGAKSLSVSLAGAIYGDGVTYGWKTGIAANAYRTGNSTWAYRVSGVQATRIECDETYPFAVHTAPSGTAGNTISFTQAMALDASGVLSLAQGQIKFPATQVGSSDANTLDDYEEGTWTGTVTTNGTPPTVAGTATGYYTKIGRVVTVRFVHNDFSMAGSTGALTVTGLPFASRNSSGNSAIGAVVTWSLDLPAGTVNLAAVVNESTSSVFFYASIDDGTYANVTDNSETAGRLWFTVTYEV